MVGGNAFRDDPLTPDMGATADEPDRTLDARDLEGPPFGPIVAALDDLESDGTLLLVNSFEPVPLYDVLAERGFDHETERVAADEWHVLVTRARTGSGAGIRGGEE